MPTTDSRREAIRSTLAHLAGGGAPKASAVAETTIDTWRQVADRLTPVIGAKGVEALFLRSLHLTSTSFPWLVMDGDHDDYYGLLARLKARLTDREPDTSAEASKALLVTFTDLLTTLIGESLTERLLGPIWAPSPASEQEIIP